MAHRERLECGVEAVREPELGRALRRRQAQVVVGPPRVLHVDDVGHAEAALPVRPEDGDGVLCRREVDEVERAPGGGGGGEQPAALAPEGRQRPDGEAPQPEPPRLPDVERAHAVHLRPGGDGREQGVVHRALDRGRVDGKRDGLPPERREVGQALPHPVHVRVVGRRKVGRDDQDSLHMGEVGDVDKLCPAVPSCRICRQARAAGHPSRGQRPRGAPPTLRRATSRNRSCSTSQL